MDLFPSRDHVVENYWEFSLSFTQIKAPSMQDFIYGRYGAGE